MRYVKRFRTDLTRLTVALSKAARQISNQMRFLSRFVVLRNEFPEYDCEFQALQLSPMAFGPNGFGPLDSGRLDAFRHSVNLFQCSHSIADLDQPILVKRLHTLLHRQMSDVFRRAV